MPSYTEMQIANGKLWHAEGVVFRAQEGNFFLKGNNSLYLIFSWICERYLYNVLYLINGFKNVILYINY